MSSPPRGWAVQSIVTALDCVSTAQSDFSAASLPQAEAAATRPQVVDRTPAVRDAVRDAVRELEQEAMRLEAARLEEDMRLKLKRSVSGEQMLLQLDVERGATTERLSTRRLSLVRVGVRGGGEGTGWG